MATWRVRGGLVLLAAACIAGGLLVPFVPDDFGRDILAGGLVLGGVAMLIVALWRRNGGRNGAD
jgi:hypothetical protein